MYLPDTSRIIDTDVASRDIDDVDDVATMQVGVGGVGIEEEAAEGWGAGAERDGDCVRGLGDEAADWAEEGGGGCDVEGRGGWED